MDAKKNYKYMQFRNARRAQIAFQGEYHLVRFFFNVFLHKNFVHALARIACGGSSGSHAIFVVADIYLAHRAHYLQAKGL